MSRSLAAACIPALFATAAWAVNPSPMNSPSVESAHHALPLEAIEPEAAELQLGAPAPMFSFQGSDGWHRSEELVAHGAMLLVFGASDTDLKGLERLRVAFDEVGIVPIAVMNLPTRRAASTAKRLGLTRALVCDPMSAIASLYHSRETASGRHVPAYFVIDTKRTLRSMYYGPLPSPELMLASAARGLGRPLPPSAFTSSDH